MKNHNAGWGAIPHPFEGLREVPDPFPREMHTHAQAHTYTRTQVHTHGHQPVWTQVRPAVRAAGETLHCLSLRRLFNSWGEG